MPSDHVSEKKNPVSTFEKRIRNVDEKYVPTILILYRFINTRILLMSLTNIKNDILATVHLQENWGGSGELANGFGMSMQNIYFEKLIPGVLLVQSVIVEYESSTDSIFNRYQASFQRWNPHTWNTIDVNLLCRNLPPIHVATRGLQIRYFEISGYSSKRAYIKCFATFVRESSLLVFLWKVTRDRCVQCIILSNPERIISIDFQVRRWWTVVIHSRNVRHFIFPRVKR